MISKNKIALDSLVIEVTRRCNMKPICSHCFRGNPENIDINLKAVDNVLDQVVELGDVKMTGGEPLLNISGIKYIFSGIKERNIILTNFVITTNGLVFSNEFVDLIKDISEYLTKWKDGKIFLFCSVDKYHNNNWGKDFISNCKKEFECLDNVFVMEEFSGGNPIKVGN